MGGSEKEPTYRGAYIRPILLIYSSLVLIGTSYAFISEGHPIMRINNCATLTLHAILFFGALFNTERSLGCAERFLRLFICLYIAIFFVLPVMMASMRASGSAPHTPKMLHESLGSYIRKSFEKEPSEAEKRFDEEAKDQLLQVFTDDDTKLKVDSMFLDKVSKETVIKVLDYGEFRILKEHALQNHTISGLFFDNMIHDIRRREAFRAGIWSGYGMEMACILTIILLAVQHHLVKRMWLHSIFNQPLKEQYLYY
ncbi:hypothetical protein GCK72_020269 [Caenorhabditis remanei]|uniref:Uncharacterized protein n=1 Tax=Caenorhabditis remanei TaxID=31234 RepID=A0A6A5GGS8_CAERE|nr:hypothetical protein GCK72_020269 [Caenorhabditis remanei]KAF1753712.1 hypothetical protein GCK72_020269 [Caenorhabditis remanei]